jgi:uncharacterized protein
MLRINLRVRAGVLCLGLLLGLSGHAGPLEEGHQAFNAQHYDEAYRLWLPLASKGEAEAQYNIALLLMKGQGVPKDERKALEWFHKAAHQGMTDAMYNIGVMFYEGKGAYRSDQSAIEWWQLAADGGNANGQYNLGVMYAFGIGIGKDIAKAMSLWQAAAAQAHPDAIDMLINAYSGKLAGSKADPAQAKYWQARKPAKP